MCTEIVSLALVALLGSLPSGSEGPGPLDVIRASNARVAELLSAGRTLGPEEKAEVLKVIESVTSFPSIAQNALGAKWQGATADQRREFVATFSRLLSASSIQKLGRYRAERFDYVGERVDGEKATVTTVAYYKDQPLRLDYQLSRLDGDWKITNYVLNDVDSARNYRKQFAKILETESLDALIARLKKKLLEVEATEER